MCGNVSTRLVHNICLGRRTEESYCNDLDVLELVMLKRNILAVQVVILLSETLMY